MKPRASALVAVLAVLAVVGACSSAPQQPPIDTSGTTTGGQGGGSFIAGDSGTDATPSAANDLDGASDALNTCISGGCLGCCTTLNVCLAGNVTSACGISGGKCQTCPSPENCISGFCQ